MADGFKIIHYHHGATVTCTRIIYMCVICMRDICMCVSCMHDNCIRGTYMSVISMHAICMCVIAYVTHIHSTYVSLLVTVRLICNW